MAIEWNPKQSPVQGLTGLWGGTQGALQQAAGGGGVFYGGRAVWMGGYVNGQAGQNLAEYISITDGGNTSDFGDMQQARWGASGASNGTRGICSGGGNTPSYGIDYITFGSPGNATSFGNLATNRRDTASVSDGSRAVIFGGYSPGNTVLDYVAIDTTGNATNFGTPTYQGYGSGAASNGSTGLYVRGQGIPGAFYITIGTTGSAAQFSTDWGGNTISQGIAAASGDTGNDRGVYTQTSSITYCTISTTGSAANFGSNNLGSNGDYISGASDGSKFVFGAKMNETYISYVDIASTGNAQGFGTLNQSPSGAYYRACLSGD